MAEDGFFSDFKSTDALGLGLAGAGTIASALSDKKRKKRLAQLRTSMLEAADAGGSNARGRVAQAARLSSGNAAQTSINRGFNNSTVATDAATGVTMNAADQMAGIDTEVGNQKAGILANTFDSGQEADQSGLGQAVGMILARRMGRGGGDESGDKGGSGVTQDAQDASPVMQPNGDPGTNSNTFSEYGPPPLETATQPTLVADAVGAQLRARRARRGGYGQLSGIA